jgi:hypothetical protein
MAVKISLGLKMGAVCSSEMLVFMYKSTWHYNPEDRHQYNTTFTIDLM